MLSVLWLGGLLVGFHSLLGPVGNIGPPMMLQGSSRSISCLQELIPSVRSPAFSESMIKCIFVEVAQVDCSERTSLCFRGSSVDDEVGLAACPSPWASVTPTLTLQPVFCSVDRPLCELSWPQPMQLRVIENGCEPLHGCSVANSVVRVSRVSSNQSEQWSALNV